MKARTSIGWLRDLCMVLFAALALAACGTDDNSKGNDGGGDGQCGCGSSEGSPRDEATDEEENTSGPGAPCNGGNDDDSGGQYASADVVEPEVVEPDVAADVSVPADVAPLQGEDADPVGVDTGIAGGGDAGGGGNDGQAEGCSTAEDCDDGNKCDGADDCVDGKCVDGEVPVCDDGSICTSDVCEPVLGCVHTPICADNDPCTTDECDDQTGECTNKPMPCDNGDVCDGEESCVDGKCVTGPAPECGDSDPCTLTWCDHAKGCLKVPTCEDNDACTDDTCDPATGVCSNKLMPCDNGNKCDGIETCKEGKCVKGEPPVCDDGDKCTLDACDQTLGCVHSAKCADTDACTDDTCDPATGECTNKPKPCDNGNVCDGLETCVAGKCVKGKEPVCNDTDPCSLDWCDDKKGCMHGQAPDLMECPGGKSNYCMAGNCECVPNCYAKTCGPDGCGDFCGKECGAGQACVQGICTAAGQPCGDLPAVGCCDAEKVVWCEAGQLKVLSCLLYPKCGWHKGTSAYDCLTDGGIDPSGLNPKECTPNPAAGK